MCFDVVAKIARDEHSR